MTVQVLVVDDEPDVEALVRPQFRREMHQTMDIGRLKQVISVVTADSRGNG